MDNTSKRHNCCLCGLYSSDKPYNVKRHIQSVHGELYCLNCDTAINNADEYKLHATRLRQCSPADKLKTFNCDQCDYIATGSRSRLICHKIKCHRHTKCLKCSTNISVSNIEEYILHIKKCKKSKTMQRNTSSAHQVNDQPSTSRVQPSTSSVQRQSNKQMRINIDDEDKVEMPQTNFDDEDIQSAFEKTYTEKWKSIMTFFKLTGITKLFNCRLAGVNFVSETSSFLKKYVYPNMTKAFKITMSAGYILMHKITKELRYFYPGRFNNSWTQEPVLIRSESDFDKYIETLSDIDLDEIFGARRPDTNYVILHFTGLAFFVNETHIPLFSVGGCSTLNECVLHSKHLLNMTMSKKCRYELADNLCFFRCLLMHQLKLSNPNKVVKNSMRLAYRNEMSRTLELASSFYKRDITSDNFKGVKMSEIYQLELHFKVNINIFQCEYMKHNTEKTIIARTIYEAKGDFDSTLNLNECNNHFSYITNLKKYAKCYWCQKCDKAFVQAYECKRHEKGCGGKRITTFVETPFRPKYNLIRTLADEGFDITGIPLTYQYRATFDCEAYFEKCDDVVADFDEASSTSKYVTHKLLSIAVTSNVEGFTEPRCFINDGSDERVFLHALRYLNKIAREAER